MAQIYISLGSMLFGAASFTLAFYSFRKTNIKQKNENTPKEIIKINELLKKAVAYNFKIISFAFCGYLAVIFAEYFFEVSQPITKNEVKILILLNITQYFLGVYIWYLTIMTIKNRNKAKAEMKEIVILMQK